MKIIKDNCYKGTRILVGNRKREMLNQMIELLLSEDFTEIQIPIIQLADTFKDKVGEENNNMMYNFKDRGERDVCLAPEYTAPVKLLSDSYFKYQKDIKLFYIQECFRGEKPQAGRFRQFTQLGVEILNPSKDYSGYLQTLSKALIYFSDYTNIQLSTDVTRGLDYYKEGKGFEISCDDLGSSKQICGGGEYEGGIGFAIGVDRILKI